MGRKLKARECNCIECRGKARVYLPNLDNPRFSDPYCKQCRGEFLAKVALKLYKREFN